MIHSHVEKKTAHIIDACGTGTDLGCSVSGLYLPKGIVPCAVKVPCANMAGVRQHTLYFHLRRRFYGNFDPVHYALTETGRGR